ncbi:response regulator [Paenactinomyces guangxiensis]|uniref:Response regulator n=1 Tax=Paenactinomyces guangxiensis TaxID=1490290 RepID=A0A7W1WNV9_9BACL|nr:response regulator [Paenactinomyces guangxiensis]MBA4493345.1 response regulator [Paenactinomyces guangxiensis]MBH8593429.1 response regulator [Paenactinomyces guangxiensis]
MYKVLIVDDDRIIRKGLSASIPWEDHGYQVVGEAGDGETGLQMIEEIRPHIVISDIKMPFMDGLEMARLIKENYPEIKVILLTGYEDFNYAKEAIGIKAFDYILKPVESAVLLEKVSLAATEWEQERKVEKKMREAMPFLRQRFLKKLIHGRCQEDEIRKELGFLGLELNGPYFAVFLVKVDDYHGDLMEKEILKFSVYNICEEILVKERKGIVFDSDRDELVLIYSHQEEAETANRDIYDLAEQIRESVKRYLKTTLTIAMGRVFKDLSGISLSYEEARSAIEFRHLIGKDQVFSIADTGLPRHNASLQGMDIENELVMKVKLGLKQEVLTLMEEWEGQLLQQKYISLHQVRLMAIQMVVLLFREAGMWAKEWEEKNRQELVSHYNVINELQTIQEIIKKVTLISLDIVSHVNARRESQKHSAIKKAVKCIEENYAKEGLSLQDVAKEVHISPTYLSILFKQEKNINFSEFLLETRMKKAMELLRNQDLKAYEVAERVGYNNPQYFSVSFKKYTGYSPLEFKKQE